MQLVAGFGLPLSMWRWAFGGDRRSAQASCAASIFVPGGASRSTTTSCGSSRHAVTMMTTATRITSTISRGARRLGPDLPEERRLLGSRQERRAHGVLGATHDLGLRKVEGRGRRAIVL